MFFEDPFSSAFPPRQTYAAPPPRNARHQRGGMTQSPFASFFGYPMQQPYAYRQPQYDEDDMIAEDDDPRTVERALAHKRQEEENLRRELIRKQQEEDLLRRQLLRSKPQPPFVRVAQQHPAKVARAKQDKELRQKVVMFWYNRSARVIQRAVRKFLAAIHAQQLERESAAAVTVQRFVRGFQARAQLRLAKSKLAELTRIGAALETVATIELPAALQQPFIDVTGKQNKSLLLTEDRLCKLMAKVDAIPSEGFFQIRTERKRLIRRAQQLLEELDRHKSAPPPPPPSAPVDAMDDIVVAQEDAPKLSPQSELHEFVKGDFYAVISQTNPAPDAVVKVERRLKELAALVHDDPLLRGRIDQLFDLLFIHASRHSLSSL